MNARGLAALTAAGVGAALVWLVFGTSAGLPESPHGGPGWAGDFLHFYLPNARYLGERLARLELPLWNPQQGVGGPFLATLQAGVLYPPNWLHAVLPAQTAFVALAAAHVVLAVVTAGALASALGAGPFGAVVAGVTYATSFNVTGSVWTPPVQYAMSWSPAILLAVDRAVARPDGRRAVALAVCLAFALLTGWPYVVAMTGLAAALYGAALLLGETVRERALPLRASAVLLVGVVGALALAAPQLLPAQELLSRSVRALGSLVEGQAIWVHEPHDPVRWFHFFEQRGFNDAVPGIAALALTACAIVLPGPGRVRLGALIGVGGVGLLLSFPDQTPLFGWLRELPVFGDFRFPYRYRLLPDIAMAMGAGVGTDHLQRLLAARPAWRRVVGAAALAASVASTTFPTLKAVRPFARSVPETPTLASELAQLGIDTEANPGWRVYWFGRSDKLGSEPGIYAVHDLEPITLARTAQMVTFFESGRALTLATVDRKPARDAQDETLSAPFYGFLSLPEKGDRAAILDLLSARWVVTPKPLAWLEERYRRVSAGEGGLVAYDNRHALPRAYRASRAIPEPHGLEKGLKRLNSDRFPRRWLVMLDDPPASVRMERGDRIPPAPGSVEIVAYEPERVVLHTSGPEPAAVVLTDADYPGWVATLDGEPATLRRANLGFRAVVVPAGEHEIEMRYRPASWRWGLALAVAAGLLCLAALRRRPSAVA